MWLHLKHLCGVTKQMMHTKLKENEMDLTNDEKEFYLMLCGWTYVKSAETNPFWCGEYAWLHPRIVGYSKTKNAINIQKKWDMQC